MTVAAATSALGPDWTDPATIGYPVLVGGVLLGSIVPVVPTGAVVGAAAAVATTTGRLSLTLVVLASALAALLGDVVTFAVARAGGPATVGWMARGQHPERLAAARRQFGTWGWQLVVVGRLLPAGRVPVLLAAGALDYPWRRLLPAAAVGCLLWAIAYTLLGVVSGGLFDSPVLATVVATILVLLVTAAGSLISRRRRRKAGTGS
jgi:membrane protein DedA with SNARE-associated domain